MKRKLLLLTALVVSALTGIRAQQTPQADGTYYLYNPETGKFLSRGAGYGTAAAADNFGIPVTLKEVDGEYQIQYMDDNTHYVSDAWWSWSDGGTDRAQTYKLESLADGKYKLKTKAHNHDLTLYINEGAAAGGFSYQVASNGGSDNCNENWDVWQFVSSQERDNIVKSIVSANESQIAQNNKYTITTTLSDLLSDANTFAATDKTSSVTNAALSENADGWTITGSTPGAQSGCLEVYQGYTYLKQTVENLPSGIYKVSLNGYYRDGSNANCVNYANDGWIVSNAYLEANGNQTMIKPWASERSSNSAPNDRAAAKTMFNEGKYLNEVYTEVGEDGKLAITIAQPGAAVASRWFCFSNLKLTYYSDKVSDEDKAAILKSVDNLTDPMNKDVKQSLETAKSTFESASTIQNYNALGAAITAAQNSINAYKNAKAVLDAILAEAENTNIYTAESFAAQYTANKNKYDDRSMTDAEASAMRVGDHYAGNLPPVLLSAWKKGETPAINNSGFYINTWSVEGNNDGSNFKTPFYEYWVGDDNVLAATTLTAVQTGLEADKDYKVSIWARVRQTNNQTKAENGITMQVGEGNAIDISAGTQIGTSPLYIGEYAAVGKTDADGKLTVTITVNEESNISWLAFKNVKYSQVILATDEQKEALANAIIAAEEHKLGFDKDEFAPYNNVEVLEALDKAKNIDVDVEDASVLVQATNQLNEATWAANSEEVNAFFDGSFASQAPKNDGNSGTKVKGWTNNVSIRTLVKSENEAEAIYKATDGHAGMYVWSGAAATYGETAGYTMPLNAHTIYKFGYKRGSWNGDNSSSYAEFVVKDPSGNIVCKLGNNEGARNYLSTEGELISYDGYFVTGEKGDYTVTINNSGNSVLTGLYLYTVEGNVLTFTDGQAVPNYAPGTYPNVKVDRKLTVGRWVTAVYPFAISGVEDLTIANATSVEEGVVKFTHVDASEANKPFFMISEEGKTNIQLENVAVAAAASANFEGEGVTTVGSYAMKTILDVEEGKTKYVLQSNKLNYVGANETWVDTYRAYLVVPTSATTGEVKQLSIAFDGDESTGINGVTVEKQFEGTIYDLSGRVVKNPSRGLYIINGKKVMVR